VSIATGQCIHRPYLLLFCSLAPYIVCPFLQGNAYIDVGCPVDAQLTAVGESQAQSLQPKLAALLKESACTQVYVSPLRRAVETALQAVNGLPVKVQANELLHEQAGLHHCDRYSVISYSIHKCACSLHNVSSLCYEASTLR
jgi:Histidine phosphatase superfamily (branch 1)